MPPSTMTETIDQRMPDRSEMEEAFLHRDASYDGLFFSAVRTTGIFCLPSCAARKPRRENLEFYPTARGALLAGFRPCKRCRPLEFGGGRPDWIRQLLERVEEDPARRWTDADLRHHGFDPNRVRRWFKEHHGMTFHAYQRARRLGAALGQIRHGSDPLETAFDHGYESLSGFNEAFSRLFGEPPGRADEAGALHVTRLGTPLGPVLVAVSEGELWLLEFVDRRKLETQVRRLRDRSSLGVVPGSNALVEEVDRQLSDWFAGRRREFDLPLRIDGTEFQEEVWRALLRIPHGETRSYGEVAREIGRPGAVRAVGRAIGDNRIAIVVPCHRVVGADGALTGYGGGLERKRWLLDHERAG